MRSNRYTSRWRWTGLADPAVRRPAAADDRTDRVRGRLDAVLIAARVAPRTRHIGIVPTAIATLDYVSTGRAGIRMQTTPSADTARELLSEVSPIRWFPRGAEARTVEP